MNQVSTDDDHPITDPSPASREWCHRLAETALQRALDTASRSSLTATDVVHLMKLRKALCPAANGRRSVIWMDPISWATDPPRAD